MSIAPTIAIDNVNISSIPTSNKSETIVDDESDGDYIRIKDALNHMEPEDTIHNNPPPKEEWNKTYGGVGEDWCYDSQQTYDGGYILVGYTTSQGSGQEDIWLVKTDMNGTMVWNKTFGGYTQDKGYSVQQTSDGGYILTGKTFSYGHGSCDLWLIKTDENGIEQWNKTHGNVQADAGRSVRQTSEDGYIITGYTRSYGCGDPGDIWLIRTNENGVEQWNRTWGGPYAGASEEGFSVEQTPDGGYILTGCYVNIGFSWDVILIKTDELGKEEWNRTWGGKNNDWGNCVKVTLDGGYIISGYVHKGSGYGDAWLIKTNVNGIEQWNKSFGGSNIDSAESVFQTDSGGYIITGYTYLKYNNSIYSNILLIETDGDGNEIWNNTLGKIDKGEKGYSIQQTIDGGYAIAGFTTSYGYGKSEFWLIKLEQFNYPPYTPSNYSPCGVVSENVINLSWDGGDPNHNDSVYYDIYFGDYYPLPKIASIGPYPANQTRIEYGPVELQDYTTYYWMIGAWDNYGHYTEGPICSITFSENHPPEVPVIDGPERWPAGKEFCFTFHSIDPDNDSIKYIIDWGDGTTNETDFYPACTPVEVCHTWEEMGIYIIRVKAIDEFGVGSGWSEFEITIPRTRATYNTLLLRLFKHFPNAFPILQQLLGLR